MPPLRVASVGGGCRTNCKGVRTFVGSRGASVDTTMDLHGGDCNWEGWPSWESLAVNKHNEAVGEPTQAYNPDLSAEGLVGDTLPTVMFYLPMYDNGTPKDRYWTYFAVPTADMKGNREQYVWMRFQQMQCSGPNKLPPCKMVSDEG